MAAGAKASIEYLKQHSELREQHQQAAAPLKDMLCEAKVPYMHTATHIVPVMVKDPVKCKAASDMLRDDYNIYVQPINFPTVPRGTERLRFTPSPVHGPGEIDALVRAMDALWSHCALNRAELSA